MRWTPPHQLTRDAKADGEGVWSWSPDAGIKPIEMTIGDGG
jgi:hypothetical protein